MHHIYEHLHLHLDRHPLGFPGTAGRRELEILKRLFTKEEAELALHLTPSQQKVEALSAKSGIAREELASILGSMAAKGIILEDKRKGEPRYSLLAFMPGIYEFQVHNMDEEMAHIFEEIYPALAGEIAGSKTPWMRVLPTELSLSGKDVIPYQKASEVVREVETIAVTDCICRKEQKLVGHGCDRPRDSICMYFTPWAEFMIDKGLAQKATTEDALKVLKRAENAGLVHLGVNVREGIGAMCQCCPCCCAVMRTVTELKMPTGIAKSDFYATAEIELCNGCEACVAVCPVSAIALEDEKAVVNIAECIGCGICVLECPTEALSINKREEDTVVTPRNWREMLLEIAKDKGKTYFFT